MWNGPTKWEIWGRFLSKYQQRFPQEQRNLVLCRNHKQERRNKKGGPEPQSSWGFGVVIFVKQMIKKINHGREVYPTNFFFFFLLLWHPGQPWDAEQLLERLESLSAWPATKLSRTPALKSHRWPGKAFECWSWGASEEATDAEPSWVINIAEEPGFFFYRWSPHNLGEGMQSKIICIQVTEVCRQETL